jgi:hypothetical protein
MLRLTSIFYPKPQSSASTALMEEVRSINSTDSKTPEILTLGRRQSLLVHSDADSDESWVMPTSPSASPEPESIRMYAPTIRDRDSDVVTDDTLQVGDSLNGLSSRTNSPLTCFSETLNDVMEPANLIIPQHLARKSLKIAETTISPRPSPPLLEKPLQPLISPRLSHLKHRLNRNNQ